VDDAGRGNRHWYREEEREGRQQDRPEAEAGIERECRGQRRHDGDCDYVHGKAYDRLFVRSASGTEVDQLRSFSIQSIRKSDDGWLADWRLLERMAKSGLVFKLWLLSIYREISDVRRT